MADVSTLVFPEKSHRKKINIPSYSIELAEFFGIMMGDGGINNPWQAKITLNSVADLVYIEYVIRLGKELFGITPSVLKRKNRQAVDIVFASTTLVDFLVAEGLPRGNKNQAGLHIPDWILSEPKFKQKAIRGLMDTDGCLYIHKHIVSGKEYKNLGLCFSTHSPPLMEQVGGIFEQFSIIPHITRSGQMLYLYSEKAISDYLRVFGTSNDRILNVYEMWKRGRVVEGARLESV